MSNPLICKILICLVIVLFPDSPVPVKKSRHEIRSLLSLAYIGFKRVYTPIFGLRFEWPLKTGFTVDGLVVVINWSCNLCSVRKGYFFRFCVKKVRKRDNAVNYPVSV